MPGDARSEDRPHDLSLDQLQLVRQVTTRPEDRFAGTFGRETIERFVLDSADRLAPRATVTRHLPLLAEKWARQRLVALARVEGTAPTTTPAATPAPSTPARATRTGSSTIPRVWPSTRSARSETTSGTACAAFWPGSVWIPSAPDGSLLEGDRVGGHVHLRLEGLHRDGAGWAAEVGPEPVATRRARTVEALGHRRAAAGAGEREDGVRAHGAQPATPRGPRGGPDPPLRRTGGVGGSTARTRSSPARSTGLSLFLRTGTAP
jgi:hypothetical protein